VDPFLDRPAFRRHSGYFNKTRRITHVVPLRLSFADALQEHADSPAA
jgi:hypothetical protein